MSAQLERAMEKRKSKMLALKGIGSLSNISLSNDGGPGDKNRKSSVRGSVEFTGSKSSRSTKGKDAETFDGAKLVTPKKE